MKPYFLIAFLCWMLSNLTAQEYSVFQLMKSDSVTHLYLTLNWKELEKDKKEKAYLPAHVMFETGGEKISMEIKVRTRGHMRLNICFYPPLKLKFEKSALSERSLKDHNEIDLVHRCQSGDSYQQYILKEYLAYKLFQVLSPLSFNVQLVRIHYLNPNGTTAYESSLGFVVEHTEELVDRLGGQRIKTPIISQHSVDKESMLRTSVFQFMIGNTDWSFRTRHNLEFLAVPGYSLLVTIPYDFDYSGLVSATYAAHHQDIGLPHVANRFYQGKCYPPEMTMKVINEFVAKKEEILSIPRTIYGIDDKVLRHVNDYLLEFFNILEDNKKLKHQIIDHCDKWPMQKSE